MVDKRRSWAALAQIRQGFHSFFRDSFLPPTDDRLEGMQATADGLDGLYVERFPFARPWRAVIDALARRPALERLEGQYVELFEVHPDHPRCEPTESSHPGASIGVDLDALSAEYERMGVSLSRMDSFPPDHVATEFEVMANLCERERVAWFDGALDHVATTVGLERDFLWRHLGLWFPEFAGAVEQHASGTVYATILEAAIAFVHHDREFVKLLSAAELERVGS